MKDPRPCIGDFVVRLADMRQGDPGGPIRIGYRDIKAEVGSLPKCCQSIAGDRLQAGVMRNILIIIMLKKAVAYRHAKDQKSSDYDDHDRVESMPT